MTIAAIAAVSVLGVWTADRQRTLPVELAASFGHIANWYQIGHGGYVSSFTAPSPVRHFWSLAVEEQFYLLWPLVLVGLLAIGVRHRRWAVPAALVALGSASVAAGLAADSLDRSYLGTDSRFVALVIGAALAWAWRAHPFQGPERPVHRRVVAVWAAVGATALLAALWFLPADSEWLPRGGFALVALAAAGVVAAAVTSRPAVALLSAAPLVFVGQLSFALYLCHWPMLIALGPGRPLWLRLLVALPVAVLVAWVLHRVVERPVLEHRVGPAFLAGGGVALASLAVVALVVSVPSGPTPSESVSAGLETVPDPTTTQASGTTVPASRRLLRRPPSPRATGSTRRRWVRWRTRPRDVSRRSRCWSWGTPPAGVRPTGWWRRVTPVWWSGTGRSSAAPWATRTAPTGGWPGPRPWPRSTPTWSCSSPTCRPTYAGSMTPRSCPTRRSPSASASWPTAAAVLSTGGARVLFTTPAAPLPPNGLFFCDGKARNTSCDPAWGGPLERVGAGGGGRLRCWCGRCGRLAGGTGLGPRPTDRTEPTWPDPRWSSTPSGSSRRSWPPPGVEPAPAVGGGWQAGPVTDTAPATPAPPTDLAVRAAEVLQSLAGPEARLRPDQLAAVEALVTHRRRVLLVQATGWGKSAVYWIATRLLRDAGAGPTLVVSPLLAVMRNQVAAAQRAGIRARPSTAPTWTTGPRWRRRSTRTRWTCCSSRRSGSTTRGSAGRCWRP